MSQDALGGPRRPEEFLGSPKEVLGGPRRCYEVSGCVLGGRSQQALNQAKAKLDLDSSQIQPKS